MPNTQRLQFQGIGFLYNISNLAVEFRVSGSNTAYTCVVVFVNDTFAECIISGGVGTGHTIRVITADGPLVNGVDTLSYAPPTITSNSLSLFGQTPSNNITVRCFSCFKTISYSYIDVIVIVIVN